MRKWHSLLTAGILFGSTIACNEAASGETLSVTSIRAEIDRVLLETAPENPIGSYGFSRYFYRLIDGEIVPILLEGPAGRQVRCQKEELPCSYLDLKELYRANGDIPAELQISRTELGLLVTQLDAVSSTLANYTSIQDACAAGYQAGSLQVPNMGIHMWRGGPGELDPTNPPTLLFAKQGGWSLNRDERGICDGDRWIGPDDYQIVGAVFKVPPSDEHPEGFAGPFDNWHVHYNLCGGALREVGNGQQGSRKRCEADGGVFQEETHYWMIHVFVAPGLDNQEGVFAMFNPMIWPRVERVENPIGFPSRHPDDGKIYAAIKNFTFDSMRASVGQPIVITNWDSFPHTVTAGRSGDETGEFDSSLGTGESIEVVFEKPGEYPLHCTLHPNMNARVVIE